MFFLRVRFLSCSHTSLLFPVPADLHRPSIDLQTRVLSIDLLWMKMGKMMSFGKILECFSLSSPAGSCSCFCMNSMDDQGEGLGQDIESKPLITSDNKQMVRLKDLIGGSHQTLAFQLKPKMVTLRVAMHCQGCARRVEKHISKMDGVTSYKIDLDSKMVVVVGDIIPFEVLESVSKVKYAELCSA